MTKSKLQPTYNTDVATLLEAKSLTKHYGQTIALMSVEFQVQNGITGLLGPNGAGKNTAIKLFLGLLKPTSGSAEVLGEKPYESLDVRSRLGYMPEHDCLPTAITASEFLTHIVQVSGIPPSQAMALATSSFGNELEDKTLGFLVLMPIARWRIVMPKVLASLVICGPLLVISGVISALLGFDGEVKPALAVAAALGAGVITYSAIFTWARLITTRALPFALVYVRLWEGVISSFIRGVDYLSVRGYTLAIMSGLDEPSFPALEDRVIELPAAIAQWS